MSRFHNVSFSTKKKWNEKIEFWIENFKNENWKVGLISNTMVSKQDNNFCVLWWKTISNCFFSVKQNTLWNLDIVISMRYCLGVTIWYYMLYWPVNIGRLVAKKMQNATKGGGRGFANINLWNWVPNQSVHKDAK